MPVQANGFHENRELQSSIFLFLKKGTTHLRILPAYSEKGSWFREVKEISWHNEEGKYAPLVSPATNGDPCPFLNEGKRLYELGGEENVEASKEFRPRSNFLFNVIVKSTPDGEVPIDECVKVLKCGVTVKRQILDLDQDFAGGWGDITNLEQGIDIRITRSGNGRFDTEYNVKGVPDGRGSILAYLEEKEYKRDLNPHNLDELFAPKSFEELTVLLERKKADVAGLSQQPQELGDVGDVPIAPIESQNTVAAPALPEVK
jgi:hypothetical protein